ncbi:MAG TPA: heavy metal-associated domain-containing protein [Bryobacteraceae bacterium]|nr:heavy metal-associated domain-containing protein [Bryobacteraceae bacterium]
MKVQIEGMHCQACVARVSKAIGKVEGARVEHVEVGSAVVSADAAREAAVLDAIRKSGYEAQKVE